METIFTLDYKTLVTVYNRISKDHVLGRQVGSDVQRRICEIREKKPPTDDLPTRMIVPNPTNRKIHFEPFYMMEFRGYSRPLEVCRTCNFIITFKVKLIY